MRYYLNVIAYWWVNQEKTFKHEYAGKFLWAPIENERQQTMFHWSNLGNVTARDTIFCYADGLIRTVATALNNTYISQKPSEFGNLWQGEGWCVDVTFLENIEPLALRNTRQSNPQAELTKVIFIKYLLRWE